ncbi:MAG: hypothetical protein ACI4QB_03820 [Eubacteriales bacterium]
MKLRYIGESFGIDGLTNGKIYEAVVEDGMYRVIDDSGEEKLYSMTNPAPLDGSSPGEPWEIVDDIKEKIHEYDDVLLKDGREASIVYIMGGPYFIADVGSSPADWETILITLDDIDCIIRSDGDGNPPS